MERALGDPPFHDPPESPSWQKFFSKLVLSVSKNSTYTSVFDPSSVAANTKVRQTFIVVGLTTNDIITVNPPALTAGLDLIGARVSATDTIELVFWNSTGAAIDEGAGTYLIKATRK
jgi:hypothetical protein